MRVAVADGSGIMRAGLVAWLEGAGAVVCHASRDAADLLRFLGVEHADAVVLDLRTPPHPSDEGLRVVGEIRRCHPRVGVLVLSTCVEAGYVLRLMTIAGPGVGYLVTDRVDDARTLVDALEHVVAGQSVVDPQVLGELIVRQQPLEALAVLSSREREVLLLMAQGRSNPGIGSVMNLSPRTIEGYVASIFTKLGVPDGTADNRRVLAVLTWLQHGGLVGTT